MKTAPMLILLVALALVGCQSTPEHTEAPATVGDDANLAIATFAGGCFWCMQPPFDGLVGVRSTQVGYTGGPEKNPKYEEVSRGLTGHVEAVEIRFDPGRISYEELLHVFWRSIDPTDAGGQFADRGPHYRSVVFYHDEEQRRLAEASRMELDETGPFAKPIVTEIVPAEAFWAAEDYHQQYYKKNPTQYRRYYVGSGRAGFLEETWGIER